MPPAWGPLTIMHLPVYATVGAEFQAHFAPRDGGRGAFSSFNQASQPWTRARAKRSPYGRENHRHFVGNRNGWKRDLTCNRDHKSRRTCSRSDQKYDQNAAYYQHHLIQWDLRPQTAVAGNGHAFQRITQKPPSPMSKGGYIHPWSMVHPWSVVCKHGRCCVQQPPVYQRSNVLFLVLKCAQTSI